MANQVPPEFKQYASYLQISNALKNEQPIVSNVMRNCFLMFIQDMNDGSLSPAAVNYIRQIEATTPEMPDNAQEVTKQFADNLFEKLSNQFQSGRVRANMPSQFFMCAQVYSTLDDEESMEREKICKVVSVKAKKMLAKAGVTGEGHAAGGAAPQLNGPPVFTPPGSSSSNSSGLTGPPVFTPPGKSSASGPPVFTPPGSGGSSNSSGLTGPPVFTPPGISNANAGGPPVFTPPGSGGSSNSSGLTGPPVFTPPGKSNANAGGPPKFTPNAPPVDNGPPKFTPNAPPVGGPPKFTPNAPPVSGPPKFTPNAPPVGGPPKFTPNAPPVDNGPPKFAPNAPSATGPPKFTPNAPSIRKGPPKFTPNCPFTGPSDKFASNEHHAPIPEIEPIPELDDFDSGFDLSAGLSLLEKLHVDIITEVPEVRSEEARSAVQGLLQTAIQKLTEGDQVKALEALENALVSWQMGAMQ